MSTIAFSQILLFAMSVTVAGLLLCFRSYWNRLLALFALGQLLLALIVVTAISDGDLSQLSLLYYGIPLVFFAFNGLLWIRDYEFKSPTQKTPSQDYVVKAPETNTAPAEQPEERAILDVTDTRQQDEIQDDEMVATDEKPKEIENEPHHPLERDNSIEAPFFEDELVIDTNSEYDNDTREDRESIESAIAEMDFISYTQYDESEDYDVIGMPELQAPEARVVEAPIAEQPVAMPPAPEPQTAVRAPQEPENRFETNLDALTAMANDALDLSGIETGNTYRDVIAPNENLDDLERTLNDLLDSVEERNRPA
ncbi:MAG: hypothetical protein O3A01_03155 [bacterium]|nr:hypothetical protein [bacterium]